MSKNPTPAEKNRINREIEESVTYNANINFKAGRKILLEYLNGLVKSRKVAFLGEEDKDYCERHETYYHQWQYYFNKEKSTVYIYSGILKLSTNFKNYDNLRLRIQSNNFKQGRKLVRSLEKVINNKN